MSDIVDNFDISWSSIEEGEFLLSQEKDDVDIEDHLYAALLKYQENEVVTEPNKRFKAQDLENCKKGRTPLFNYNPNSEHFLTYDQPSVVMKGKTLVSLETSILPNNQKNSVHFDAVKIVSRIKNPTYLETNLKEVRETLNQGCFCNTKNCFSNLDPEDVFEHRANMSKLSITDRNMFLMGALMTCMLQNENHKRGTIKYAYKGKRVCGDAFLYLQFCTFQQLNRVRDWLVHNGVGSVQYSEQDCTKVLFRAMYRPIKEFIIEYIEVNVGDVDIDSKKPIIMPVGVTKKSLHEEYQAYILKSFPGRKLLGYNSFSKFLLQYFPQLMFRNVGGVIKINNQLPANKVLNSIQNSNVKKAVEVEKIQAVSPFLVIPPPTRYTNVSNSGGQIANSNYPWNSSSASSFSISSDLEI